MAINSRRSFLKNSATAALSLLFFNPLRNLFASPAGTGPLPPWEELVDYARWGPTIHNLQPHKIKVLSPTEAELYYDPQRLLPVGDPASIFTTVAMGVFVEHLSIAASANGARVEITQVFNPIRTDATALTLFAKLRLQPAVKPERLNRKLIAKRKTSRLHYDGHPVGQRTLAKIKKESERFEHEFFASSDPELIDFLIGLNQQTLFEDLGLKRNRDELIRLFRYTQEEAEAKKDGLWAKCMGFPGNLMKSVFAHHDRWEKGVRRKLLGEYYKRSFNGTKTICWFSGKFDTTADWLNAGKMFARTWLLATEENAYIHPLGSLITNAGAYEKINEKFPKPAEGGKIWMIFRAGYSSQPARSYRLATEEIIMA